MKFGESLSEGLVPEWKDQYVDYKLGKKLIKKIAQMKDALPYVASDGGTHSEPSPSPDKGAEANDRTPLLNPVDSHVDTSKAYSDNQSVPSRDGSLPRVIESPREESNRRPSVFHYSMKSAKDKQEDYEEEVKKFFTWLDSELAKVDGFFTEKEHEAYERFLILQDQLYQLRDHRNVILKNRKSHDYQMHISDITEAYSAVNDIAFRTKSVFANLRRFDIPSLPSTRFLDKWRKKKKVEDDTAMMTRYKTNDDEFDPNFRENQIRNGILTSTSGREYDELASIDSEDIESIQTSSQAVPDAPETSSMARQNRRSDYIKKKKFSAPYPYARKQLKAAVIEHYRALSLIKSYKSLNRTAFRKITKKYDKATRSTISLAFMKRVDNSSYFQSSDLIDKLFIQVEELYLTFFEQDLPDRKRGLEKLKSSAYAYNNMNIRQPSYYSSFFASGFLLGVAIPLLIIGIYNMVWKTLSGTLPEGQFLLQVWGGFFIITLTLLLFGINFLVFDIFKINYKFIFEFNLATALNYKQFWFLPSLSFAALSLVFWFASENYWPDEFPSRDWPWLYLGLFLIVFFWPGPQFYGPSRKWLQIALWRLLLSGFYPVEFRDFFLGDIFCSLTYTMGNISFFFCLYAHQWNGLLGGGPPSHVHNVCGSSKSRLMGFFSTLPSIWRFLQCVRRYCDTGDWFPHLANMMKYGFSALYYCLLSVWRIQRTSQHRAIFIVFAVINSLYTSTWDIVMDWSLGQPGSQHKFLRNHLFFKRPVYYYTAIVLDVALRFQWVFYAFFSHQIQQLAITSFCIALAEVIRRFIWVFFRMENEHCTNVILFRASRDSPLPYTISSRVEKAIKKLVDLKYHQFDFDLLEESGFAHQEESRTTSVQQPHDEEADLGLNRMPTRPLDGLSQLSRRKSAIQNISDALHRAHIKDFQRRRKPVSIEEADSDDDEEDEDEAVKVVTRQTGKTTRTRASKSQTLRRQ